MLLLPLADFAAWTPGILLIFVPHTSAMLPLQLAHMLEIELMLSMIKKFKNPQIPRKSKSGNIILFGTMKGMDGQDAGCKHRMLIQCLRGRQNNSTHNNSNTNNDKNWHLLYAYLTLIFIKGSLVIHCIEYLLLNRFCVKFFICIFFLNLYKVLLFMKKHWLQLSNLPKVIELVYWR